MAKKSLKLDKREEVIFRAINLCEYCQSQDKYSPNSFTIDHYIPEEAGGTDDILNLIYACFLCNRLKSNKLNGFDSVTQSLWPIFNPRKDNWSNHFTWNEDTTLIIGITPIGRCTVSELQLNRKKLIEYRKALLVFGEHPPKINLTLQ
jgi:hypothetical protein